MEHYMNRLMIGKVRKKWLYSKLVELLKETDGKCFDQSAENIGYQLGHHFGTQDTLKKILDLLDKIPEDDPMRQPINRVMGRDVYER